MPAGASQAVRAVPGRRAGRSARTAVKAGAPAAASTRSSSCVESQRIQLVDPDWRLGHLATIGAVTVFTTPFGREEIEQIIPHRDPFLLIDEVVELEPGARVRARFRGTRRRMVPARALSRRSDHARGPDGRGPRPGRRRGRALASRLPRTRAAVRRNRRRALPPRRASRRRARLRADRRPPAQDVRPGYAASCAATARRCSTRKLSLALPMPEGRLPEPGLGLGCSLSRGRCEEVA